MLEAKFSSHCDRSKITVWLRGNPIKDQDVGPFVIRERSPLVSKSEGLISRDHDHNMLDICCCIIKQLVNYHDIVCHYVYACFELASTFNVLTWHVMPDFKKVSLERSAVRV